MPARFRDLRQTAAVGVVAALGGAEKNAATPEVPKVGNGIAGLALVLVLAVLASYQLGGMTGLWFGAAVTTGAMLAIPVAWLTYLVLDAIDRRRFRNYRRLCPHCDGVYEGRRVCRQCAVELPPICYLLNGIAQPNCPGCGKRLTTADRLVRCFHEGCDPSHESLGFDRVPALVVLLIVKDLRPFAAPAAFVPSFANTSRVAKQVFAGPRGSAIIHQVVDAHFSSGPDSLSTAAMDQINITWVGDGVNRLAVEKLRNLVSTWRRIRSRIERSLWAAGSWQHIAPDLELASGMTRQQLESHIHSHCYGEPAFSPNARQEE